MECKLKFSEYQICLLLVIAWATVAGVGPTYGGSTTEGKCISSQTAKWDCDLETFSAAVKLCDTSKQVGVEDPQWKRLGSEAEAIQFLKAKFAETGSVLLFGNWLTCQGFYVYGGLDRTVDDFTKTASLGYFTASFNRKQFEPYTLNWLNPLSWTGYYDYQDFLFELDQSGHLKSISVIEPL